MPAFVDSSPIHLKKNHPGSRGGFLKKERNLCKKAKIFNTGKTEVMEIILCTTKYLNFSRKAAKNTKYLNY
jgi:hypothetical protein